MLCALLAAPPVAGASCPPGIPANEIEVENCLPGTPASEWDVDGAGSPAIQGFATDISVNQGETVAFKVDTTASSFSVEIYRMGWYGGDGARLVDTVQQPVARDQPACPEDPTTGLIDCANWSVSATWSVPSTATSGIYFAKLDAGSLGSSHVFFIVRDDDGGSDLLFQTSDTTWQAYNRYGGNSLYVGGPGTNPGRAYKVSYNRPLTTRDYAPEDAVFNSEYPMVRWLERNGYDVSYSTGVDSDRRGAEILEHKAFLSVGHDEYWSAVQRANAVTARDAGVHLAFFSGNEVFWKTRWEDNHKTLVSYKETHAGAKIDPSAEWTGTWRDPRFSPPSDGGRPENALTGTIFTVNSGTTSIEVPAEEGKLRLWRHTTAADLAAGQAETLGEDTLGYEWDEDLDNGARPAGLVRLSSTTATGVQKLQDYGRTYAPGTATHHLTLYRDTNGAGPDALVFGAGTVQWSWGLDAAHDGRPVADNRTMQQATANLFADMGVQAPALQADLVRPTASADVAPPSSAIAAPAPDAALEQGRPVTISGTATDVGGRVGAVEVSVDGGASWHPADGRHSWRYLWTPSGAGEATILARAADDSGNLGAATQRAVTVVPRSCPCTLFGNAVPASPAENDGQSIEVGTRFRPSATGTITGLRYYRGAGWTGTPVGKLYSSGGQLLATVTFPAASAAGWQQAQLSQPVPVTAGTTYVATYLSQSGHYAFEQGFFAADHEVSPLVAPADTPGGPNGVYRYGAGFPTDTFEASNYWADVVFVPADTTAPAVTAVAPAPEATAVAREAIVTATFSEPLEPGSVTSSTFRLRDAGGAVIPATVAYDAASRTARLTPAAPLAHGTRYTATVYGVRDVAGNVLAGDHSWSFTTVAAPAPPIVNPPGPTADVIAPRVTLGPKRVRATRSGRVAIRVRCPSGEVRCAVQLRLKAGRRALGSARFTVDGGRARSVRIRLSRWARRTLARRPSLRATAVATATDAAGNRATRRVTIVIRAPRRG